MHDLFKAHGLSTLIFLGKISKFMCEEAGKLVLRLTVSKKMILWSKWIDKGIV